MSEETNVAIAAPVAPVEIVRPEKPTRGFTKRLTTANIALAWAAIGGAMALGHEMAALIAPIMVMLILTLAGVYQGVGHLDLRALSAVAPRLTTEPEPEPEGAK